MNDIYRILKGFYSMNNYIILGFFSKLVIIRIFPLVCSLTNYRKNPKFRYILNLVTARRNARTRFLGGWPVSYINIPTKTCIKPPKKIMAKNFMRLNYVHMFNMYMFTCMLACTNTCSFT